jgi:hypothetical protein
LESLQLVFRVRCEHATRFGLPVTYNAYSTVLSGENGKELHRIPYSHRATDPRMIIEVAGSKTEVIVVHLPTLWGVLW